MAHNQCDSESTALHITVRRIFVLCWALIGPADTSVFQLLLPRELVEHAQHVCTCSCVQEGVIHCRLLERPLKSGNLSRPSICG